MPKKAARRSVKKRTPVPDYLKKQKLPNLNPNKAPVTSAGQSAAQMRDMSPAERKAANRANRGRSKTPQIKKGQDTRPMVQRRYEAETKAEAGAPTGAPVVKKAEAGLSRWQASVSANPSRAKKPWKNKSKATGKTGSTSATGVNKSKTVDVSRGSSAQALKAAGKKQRGRKPRGARVRVGSKKK